MFERGVQTVYHFASRFEERLRFRFIDLVNVAAEMFDQFPEFFPNIRGMRPWVFRCNRFHIMRSPAEGRADASEYRN